MEPVSTEKETADEKHRKYQVHNADTCEVKPLNP